MLSAKEIRAKFLSFFKERGHHIVPSAPIVTKDDPTLLFINSGMAPFKDIFLSNQPIVYPRIADTQKCLRASGKHNDLEDVGVDTYHHTMFEMLGNWSFGDYFKKEAITFAWELLTEVYKIDVNKIYITIFAGDVQDGLERDTEAEEFWLQYVSADKILACSKKDNFWEMGDAGPCGPCSEIHVDMRSEEERRTINGRDLVNKDHPQVIEIWNLVFMQYERKANGSLYPLAKKHIDTGMGFERLCMVLQNKTSNYDTDVFTPLIAKIENIFGVKYTQSTTETDIAIRVLSDHIRTISFCIADGQLPSNNGAGYVVRRILRRAVRYAYSFLGAKKPFLSHIFRVLKDQMGDFFPELQKQSQLIQNVLLEEETSFLHTLEKGILKFNEYVLKNQDIIAGDFAFELYDTYGFPIDLTVLLAKEQQKTVDLITFEAQLQAQKSRSRNASTITASDWIVVHPHQIEKFVGYDQTIAQTVIIQYRKIDQQGKTSYQLVLEKTPFYPEGGGQVGDTGALTLGDETIAIIQTKKENNQIIHYSDTLPTSISGTFTAKIDVKKRRQTEANHSVTHLLHEVLRKTLGSHVEQRGSLVNERSLRFDFSHFAKLSPEELQIIAQEVNAKIAANLPVIEQRDISLEEAKKAGAMALFGEKYGEKVRMMQMGSSVELCGGTHVKNTSEIGHFKIISESSVASGIRRIEALTGEGLLQYYQEKENLLTDISTALKHPQNLLKAVQNVVDENKKWQEQVEILYRERAKAIKLQIANTCQNKQEVALSFITVENFDPKRWMNYLNQPQNQLAENGMLIVLNTFEGNAQFIISIAKKLSEKGYDANKIAKELAPLIDGKGGGQPFYASINGKSVDVSVVEPKVSDKINEMFQKINMKIQ